MPARNARGFQPQRLIVVMLLAVVAYLTWDKVESRRRLGSPEYLAELANKLEADADAGRHAQMVLETRALAEAESVAIAALVSSARAQLQVVKPQAERLAAELAALQSGPRGRAIAVQSELLEEFHAALDGFAVTPESLAIYDQSLTALAAPVDAAIAAKAFDKPPAPELRGQIETLAGKLRDDAKRMTSTQRKIEAIVAAAPPTAEGPTLAEALSTLEERWAAAGAAAVREATERVRAEYRQKLAAQAAAEEQAAREAELANQATVHAAKLRADKIAADAEAQRIADEAEEARLAEERRVAEREVRLKAEAAEREYQAALPEIERYLAAFITPGHKQLIRDRWVYTEETKPISYSALKARHAMRKDNTGQMYFVSYAASEGNDRPGGPFAGFRPGPVPAAMVPDIVRAQNLLEKYADKLIEHGRLLP